MVISSTLSGRVQRIFVGSSTSSFNAPPELFSRCAFYNTTDHAVSIGRVQRPGTRLEEQGITREQFEAASDVRVMLGAVQVRLVVAIMAEMG